ncbi:hypothetical protein I5219_10305 [Neisseria gonorrhoeae]|nr:hypothetical protein [Neisseria gonorrhoeae]
MCVEQIAPPGRSVIPVLCIPMMKQSRNSASEGKTAPLPPMSHCSAGMMGFRITVYRDGSGILDRMGSQDVA